MFSGIVEAVVPALSCEPLEKAVRLRLQKPDFFQDLKAGDSIAVNGVCLTLEDGQAPDLSFVLAAETLRVLRWDPAAVFNRRFNLERSLRLGDRIHGHWVSGHVDSLGEVAHRDLQGQSLFLEIKVAPGILPLIWVKGSIALNGVSLTINEIRQDLLSVCLIPETQARTNLADLRVGETLTVEPDLLARAVRRALETGWTPQASLFQSEVRP